MTLELTAVPLAFLAGVVGVLSPCVWPLVPVVTASAGTGGRSGPLFLALGLSLSFAVAGTGLTFLLVSLGLDPEVFRYAAAGLLVVAGLILVVRVLGDRVTLWLSALSSKLRLSPREGTTSAPAQFGVGALLGIVWLPCVGPTLGAAIALASLGQDLGPAFVVMLAYGVGTAAMLLVAGYASAGLLSRWRPQLLATGGRGKKLLGGTLLLLGVLVMSGADKVLEAAAVDLLPTWAFSI
ncbi:MAG: cytochrome c biogenesis CcdA family protein [Bacteroidota bacterium]